MKLKPISIIASKQDKDKEASKVDDGKFSTRWAAEGDGEWIEFTFDKPYIITRVDLTGYHLYKDYYFEINGKKFINEKGRKKDELTTYYLVDLYIVDNKIRIIGHGNNTTKYNSYREIQFYGEPITDPIAIIRAPIEAHAGEEVVLDGMRSKADTLKMVQISGPKVLMKIAGPFRQSFKAPYANGTIVFRVTAHRRTRQHSIEVSIKIVNIS